MGKIHGDTGCIDNIVEGELIDDGAGFQEKRHWLWIELSASSSQ